MLFWGAVGKVYLAEDLYTNTGACVLVESR